MKTFFASLLLASALSTATVSEIPEAGPHGQKQPEQGQSEYGQARQPLSSYIDDVANKLLAAYETPGMAITVVQGGEILHAKGYGIREMRTDAAVDSGTYFRIASASKAFTAAALATLIDEGKMDWDDKVVSYLPDFQMHDPWVTREFTVRDLLTHRAGLGIGAGDLMLWPAPAGFTRTEIIQNLRHLKPVSSFRSEYAYDNLLYIVAGELVQAITGKSWEEYVQEKLLVPLDNNCYTTAPEGLQNTALPHQLVEGELQVVERNAITSNSAVYAAAGGISCNIDGLAGWMRTWLAGGITHSGSSLFSEEQRDEMWQGVTLMNPSGFERDLFNTHFKSYALGWRKIDAHGVEFISHTGALSGARAWVGMIPELDLGIAIVDNGNNSLPRNTLMTALISRFTGQPEQDWMKVLADRQQALQSQRAEKDAAAAKDPIVTPALPLEHYTGAYKDNWFGWVDIELEDGALIFTSRKSKLMKGTLEHASGNRFIVRWHDRSLEADAWVKFEDDFDGQITGIRMKAVSDDTDTSYDFQDLAFVKKQ